jgi:chorismate mutase
MSTSLALAKSKKLNKCRQEIDLVDQEIAKLCRRRLRLTRQIFKLKKQIKMKPVDAARELEIQRLFAQRLNGKSTKFRLNTFVRSLLQLNPQYPLKSTKD